MENIMILFAAFLGGVIQAMTGFGSGIVIMAFLPHFFPVPLAASISNMITFFLIISFVIQYRKEIDFSSFPLPFLCYAVTSGLAITWSAHVNSELLKPAFGLFLIGVAIYFAFVASSLKLKPSIRVCAVCASLSGLLQGLFGISGPPMALYFLLISKTKEKYVGNLQAFSLFTGTYALFMRAYNGTIKVYMFPLVALGVIGVLAGKWIGFRVVAKMDMERMKKIVYLFLGLSGFWTFITNI